jgi:Ca2+-binding RTX toxin-like protein
MALFIATPGVASAATTCDYSGGLLDVQLPASGDRARLVVSGTGEIEVHNVSNQVACTGVGGPPSVSNTNVISMVNGANAIGSSVEIVAPSRFAPGANTLGENGGDPEIEISVNLNDGTASELTVGGGTIGVPIRFGASGINPNAIPGEVQPDADIFPTGVGGLLGVSDQDVGGTVSAAGGAGTGGPLTRPITLEGGQGVDLLIGGEGIDNLRGADGPDTLNGGGGNDSLVPGGDAAGDSMDGGAGTDGVQYHEASAGVTVDLAIVGPQNTGAAGSDSLAGLENVTGTPFADVLRGDGVSNRLTGSQGGDDLDGRGGVDTLEGGPGADSDSLFVRDGGPDSADCGPDLDTVTADQPGVDTLLNCETVLFPLVAAPIQPTQPTAPGAAGPVPTGQRAAAIKRCKKKLPKGPKRKKCIKKAKRLPV